MNVDQQAVRVDRRVFEQVESSEIRPKWRCKYCGGWSMISTDAHSQTATHLSNLPEILRPGYTGQIDQPESVDAECTDPQVHQNDQFSDGVEMEYTDVGPTEDQSDSGVSGSDGNEGTMRDVINIFKPVCSNKGKVSEVEGGEEGDVEDEEEGDGPDYSGWFPFGGLLVSNHKSGEAGTFRSAGVRSADEGFDFTPAAQPLISVLMAGYLHHILSRAQYLKVCTLMGLSGTKLRKWTAIWRIRKSLRAILNMEPIQRESVFNNQCFSLSVKRIIALVSHNALVKDINPIRPIPLNMT
ncbi:hypothetical protein PtA15_13A14 [Puccinia triticina]|uniref:BED-type domain-containing protein n=1 Tax=Puccinia triticina TaxID=208348 RepID=A0ABY7CZK2_9BASI|nr:uncharacterized protein PtA15_13A14 [Puccinia triticina]WAQ90616.1 hypothetical protein PtA15_13A14 [Puccinia triticina]